MKTFFAISILFILIYELEKVTLLHEYVLYNSFSSELSDGRISDLLEKDRAIEWLRFIIIPFNIFIKACLVTLCIQIGAYYNNFKLSSLRTLGLTIYSEWIFVVPHLIKVAWFLVMDRTYTVQDLQYFSPLSLLNLFDKNTVAIWWVYPLQKVNLFEGLYCYLITLELSKITNKKIIDTFLGITIWYCFGLFCWIAFYLFITLNFM